jgi:hypothetical protein
VPCADSASSTRCPASWTGFKLNTAITLPVGVEAYGAYALGAWLAPGGVPGTARKFARRSAVGSLALGMAGQVVYHLLAAAHAHRAPWPVVVLVSCMPVVTLGFGAALTHLLRAVPEPAVVPDPVPGPDPELVADRPQAIPAPGNVPEPEAGLDRRVTWLTSEPESVPAVPAAVPDEFAGLNGHAAAAAELFAADLEAGQVPAIRAIRSGLQVGQDKAQQVQAYLRTRTRTP